MSLQAGTVGMSPKRSEIDMNTLIGIVRSIKAALFGTSANASAARTAPPRAKLAGRNGYGNDHIPPPNP